MGVGCGSGRVGAGFWTIGPIAGVSVGVGSAVGVSVGTGVHVASVVGVAVGSSVGVAWMWPLALPWASQSAPRSGPVDVAVSFAVDVK